MIIPIISRDRVDRRLETLFFATLETFVQPTRKAAPLGIHWCLFPPEAGTSELGPDGHAPRIHPVGEALFPRRMWVGGSLRYHAPIPARGEIVRTSSVRPAEQKEGKKGALVVTGFEHHYRAAERLVLTERQDIVFLPAAEPFSDVADMTPVVPLPEAELCWPLRLTETLLFRYSALTFNTHRIHYDAPYARQQEGYPGIVVQGPLQATILLNLAAASLGRPPERFDYRAVAPLFVGNASSLARQEEEVLKLSVHDANGRVTMEATAV